MEHNINAICRSIFRMAMLCLIAVASRAEAQGIAGSFEQLRLLVRPGDVITVTDIAGREMTGRITALSSASLALLADGVRRELTEPDVTTIRQRRQDSLANGAVWGLVSGAALAGALVATFWERGDSAGEAAALVAVYGGLGAGIGVGVDALITRRQVIYDRAEGTPKFAVSAALGNKRQRVLLTMRF